MKVTLVKAELKMLPVYQCSVCGTERTGSTQREELQARDMRDLCVAIGVIRARPHHMPVGWSSWMDGFKCPSCTGA